MTSNARFLALIPQKTAQQILENISKHYGISITEVLEEVLHEEAENLLDYVTGPERVATSVLMQKYGFHQN